MDKLQKQRLNQLVKSKAKCFSVPISDQERKNAAKKRHQNDIDIALQVYRSCPKCQRMYKNNGEYLICTDCKTGVKVKDILKSITFVRTKK